MCRACGTGEDGPCYEAEAYWLKINVLDEMSRLDKMCMGEVIDDPEWFE